ncbi:MAG: radical SAM protein [bacterium]|nr:radical SAM protein [bacterium]
MKFLKSMRALFINPPVYDFSAFDLWSKPYGFLFIVDLFVRNGWDVSFFDFLDRNHSFYDGKTRKDKKYGCGNYYYEIIDKPAFYRNVPRRYKRFGLPNHVFIEFLENAGRFDVIVITCAMTYWYSGMLEVIKICKNFTDSPIVIGGVYPTFCYQHAKTAGADIVFQGGNIRKFVEIFNENTPFHLNYIENLKPCWNVYEKLSYLVVRTTFGCPFSCYYCGVNKIHPVYLLRNQDEVVQEAVKNLERYRVNDIAFYDDALLYNFDHLRKIVEKITEAKKVNFHTPNGIHPRFINNEMASFLKMYNFKTIRLSVESFDIKRQHESSNKLFFSEFERAMKNLITAGFSKEELAAYILAGLPGQKFEEVTETVKILKNFPCKIKIAEYSPIPGTIDFEISKKLYPELPLDEPLYQNNSIFPLWNFEGKWEKINWLKNFVRDS